MRTREAEFLRGIRLRSSERDFEIAADTLRLFREDLIAGINDGSKDRSSE